MQPNLIDQLEVFLTVAETGSFSAAAKQLGRAVSAVSYAIANLEAQLQIELFDRSGYRPELTEAGRAVLADAEIIFRRVDRLMARAEALKTQGDVELTIAVDIEFDTAALARAASRFHETMPHAGLRFYSGNPERILTDVTEKRVQIGIIGLYAGLQAKKFDGREIAAWPKRIVAAPSHPLARLNAPFPLIALDDYRQIVLADRKQEARDFDYKVHTTDVWIVDSKDMLLALLREGLGWTFAIEHLVTDDLAAGRLKVLECSGVTNPPLQRFAAFWAVKAPPGPTALHFLDCLTEMGHRVEELRYRPGPPPQRAK
jgi:DNA-binding transcriptional LysR family regulator